MVSGIGDNILTAFRKIFSEHIEYLSPVEVSTIELVGAIEDKIGEIIEERVSWDNSTDGSELRKLKGKLSRSKTALKKLGVMSSVAGVTSAAATVRNFLDDVTVFINSPGDEDDECNLDDEKVEAEGGDGEAAVEEAMVF